MDQVITFRQLADAFGVLIGLAIVAIGAVEFIAGAKSNDSAKTAGCVFITSGSILAAASLFGCAVR